jgi:hypothetical protein
VAAKVALAGTGEHFVAVDGKEYRVPAGTRGTVALGDLAVDEEPQVAVRGVDEYYSKHLFAIPYSPEFARQYLAADYEAGLVFTREYEREWYENPLGWAGVGVGAALLGAGIYFYVAAADERDLALLADWGEDRAVHNDRVGTYNDLTIAAGVAGGAAAAAGVALFILDRPTYSVEFAPRVGSGLTVAPLPGGVMVEQRF